MPNPAGLLTQIDYPNGVAGTLAYDNVDRLTSIAYADSMSALETISYVVDAVGNRTRMTDSSGTTDYTYDALYRLTEVEYPNSDLTEYGYDAVGNRTSLTINGGTPITNTYNDANALTASGSDSYSYDDNGNLISKTVSSVTTTYTWDALNRMTGLGDGTTTASYIYNGDGLRVAKTVNSVATDYTWDPFGVGSVIADGDEYVWGMELIGEITSGNAATYAHQDGLGSVRLLTNGAASVVGTETYDAFGASRLQSGASLPFSYAGEQVDNESGLVYLRARYLDPAIGRFVSRDPIGLAGGDVNLYAYVGNHPINAVDPGGLQQEQADGILAHQLIEAAFLTYMNDPNWRREVHLGPGAQADLHNQATGEIYEIKKNNKAGRRDGQDTINRYCAIPGVRVAEEAFPVLPSIRYGGRILRFWQDETRGLVLYQWYGESEPRWAQQPLQGLDAGSLATGALFGAGAGFAAIFAAGLGGGGAGLLSPI